MTPFPLTEFSMATQIYHFCNKKERAVLHQVSKSWLFVREFCKIYLEKSAVANRIDAIKILLNINQENGVASSTVNVDWKKAYKTFKKFLKTLPKDQGYFSSLPLRTMVFKENSIVKFDSAYTQDELKIQYSQAIQRSVKDDNKAQGVQLLDLFMQARQNLPTIFGVGVRVYNTSSSEDQRALKEVTNPLLKCFKEEKQEEDPEDGWTDIPLDSDSMYNLCAALDSFMSLLKFAGNNYDADMYVKLKKAALDIIDKCDRVKALNELLNSVRSFDNFESHWLDELHSLIEKEKVKSVLAQEDLDWLDSNEVPTVEEVIPPARPRENQNHIFTLLQCIIMQKDVHMLDLYLGDLFRRMYEKGQLKEGLIQLSAVEDEAKKALIAQRLGKEAARRKQSIQLNDELLSELMEFGFDLNLLPYFMMPLDGV